MVYLEYSPVSCIIQNRVRKW